MAILITGGCGYIGSHTCIELLAAGYDIVVVDNYYNAKPEALRRVQELAGKAFPLRMRYSGRRGTAPRIPGARHRRGDPFRRAEGGGRIGAEAPDLL